MNQPNPRNCRRPGFLLSSLLVVALGACATEGAEAIERTEGPTGDFAAPSPGADSADSANVSGQAYALDTAAWTTHVVVRLSRVAAGGTTIAFGLPLPPNVTVTDVTKLKISVAGGAVISGARAREILAVHDAAGVRTKTRAVQIQLPSSAMTGTSLDVDVAWAGGNTASTGFIAWKDVAVSRVSASTAPIATRTIQNINSVATLVTTSTSSKTLYTGREPYALAVYPDGYLAHTRLLGQQIALSQMNTPGRAGLKFLGEALRDFGKSVAYRDGYPVNPASDSVVDPIANYEGWLYDRCSTWLVGFTVVGDTEFLREGMRACSYYQSKIDATGFFTGKPTKDDKYSHLRGLYAYYALTGDEDALAAGRRIADLWYNDIYFVGPYSAGKTRGPDKLWTERLLGTSMEGLYYGARLTGDTKYLGRFKAVLDTAYKHITGNAAQLAAINPGIPVQFPPQNCFVHTGLQQDDAGATDPWCSMWMSELMVDVLLRWQEQSNDVRVDEIFVRLTRGMRDFASAYVWKANSLGDSFLAPSMCDVPADGVHRRMLAPTYGAGIRPGGARAFFGDGTDAEHCTDASAISAAGIRALSRQGKMNGPGTAPFATEGASFLALHHDLASCAQRMFQVYDRPRRSPLVWTAAQLAPGVANPSAFIASNKIGYPRYPVAPQRKFSWWFNMSTMQMAMLEEVGVNLATLTPGQVKKPGCP